MKLRMPPDIVIRPSGIWDSRAPFHNYLKAFKRVNRTNYLAVLAAERIKRDLKELDGSDSVRQFLAPRRGARRESSSRLNQAWQRYKNAVSRDSAAEHRRSPTPNEVFSDLEGLISTTRYSSLLSHVSLFEHFAQCWSLNVLLAKLEMPAVWSTDERYLASMLSPVHASGIRPGFSTIIRCLPELRAGLRTIPPYWAKPEKKGGGPAEASPEVNGLAHLNFWIDVRNAIVHNGGRMSASFCKRHETFWATCYEPLEYVGTFKPSERIKIHQTLFNQAALGLYRCALWMTEHLISLSGERRGHPLAPSPQPQTKEWGGIPDLASPLLIEGDHALSYAFATDNSFRIEFVAEYS